MASYSTYADIFDRASTKYNIDKKLLVAVAKTESNFNANATSSAGAKGIMQLMDSTAKSLGVKDSYNAEQNIMGGAKYLSKLLTSYNGDTDKALASYFAGSGNVSKYGASKYSYYYNKVYKNMSSTSEEIDAYNNLKERADEVIENADNELAQDINSKYGFLDSMQIKIVEVIAIALLVILFIVFIALSVGATPQLTKGINKIKKVVETKND